MPKLLVTVTISVPCFNNTDNTTGITAPIGKFIQTLLQHTDTVYPVTFKACHLYS